jgi:hypothetical protein
LAANPQLIVRVAANIDELGKNLAAGLAQIKATESGLQRMGAAFSGDRIAKQAENIVGALKGVEGVTKLTAAEQARVNRTLDEAIQKYTALGKDVPAAWREVYDATKKVEQATEGVAKASQGMSVALGAAVGTLAGNLVARGLASITSEMGRMWEQSQRLGSVQTAFGRLASGAGADASEMLRVMREGTQGLVSNLDMMQSANKAMLLGLPVTTESMGTMAEAATKLGRAMGQDATKSLDDLITALGRSSPLILDNLGLTVKVGEANEAYAKTLHKTADALTDAEKKMAFYVAAMDAARTKAKELGDTQLTLSEQFTRAWTSVTNTVVNGVSIINKALGEQTTIDINDPTTPTGLLRAYWEIYQLLSKAPQLPSLPGLTKSVTSADAASYNQYLARAMQRGLKAPQAGYAGSDLALGAVPAAPADAKAQAAAEKAIAEWRESAAKWASESYKLAQAQRYEQERYNAALQETLTFLERGIQFRAPNIGGALPMTYSNAPLISAVAGYGKLPKNAGGFNLPSMFTGASLVKGQFGFDKAFGMSPQEFSSAMGQTVVRAFEGGGSPGKAVGSLLGSTLGEGVSKKLASDGVQKALSGSMSKMLSGAVGMALPAVGALIGPLVTKLGSVVSAGVEKLFGNSSKGAREAFASSMGFKDLGALYDDLRQFGQGGNDLATFGSQRVGRNDKAGNERWMADVKKFYADTKGLLDKYALSIGELNTQQRSLTDTLADDYARLKALGFGDARIAGVMGGGLNEAIRAAVKAGTSIPQAMRPVLETLIRTGGLADDVARLMLGISEPVTRDWKAMQDAAERYGLTVDALGNGFKAAKLDSLVSQLTSDWQLLNIPGAQTNTILAAMAPQLQEVIDASLSWGYEIPVALRPLVERMASFGLLVTNTGDRLETLDGLSFGVDLTQKIDELIDRLGVLIDTLTGNGGVADALSDAFSGIGADMSAPSGTGYTPDGQIDPNGAYGYQWGGAQAAGGDYMVNRPTLFVAGEAGPEQVSFSGANRGLGGGTVVVELDGRLIAQAIIPALPGELKRLRLA